jgi:restriction endonuclease S subunit
MLEGLERIEAIEIKLSEVKTDNQFFRIDGEYYQKAFTENDRFLRSKKFDYVKNLLTLLTDGKHGGVDFKDEGVLFLRNTNVKAGIIDLNDKRFISHSESAETLRAELTEGDILLTTIGSIIGESVVIPEGFPKATINQNLVKLVPHDKIISEYLSTFFNSKFGVNQIYRFAAGNIWLLLNYPNLREVKIPLFSDDFYKAIKAIHNKRNENIKKSEELYCDAESILLSKNNLSKWKPSQEAKAIKSFSSSYAISGRLDAEYYQPKYDEVLQIISKVNHKNLGCIATLKKSIEPGSDAYQTEGIPFIRVSDISKFDLSQPEIHLDRKAFNIEELKPKKDTILLSKDGSVGIAYKVEQDLDVITSSALLHLTITDKEVLPDYLTLVLNSKLTQMQAERDAGGSIIQHWRPDEIKQVLIPVLPMDTQKELTKQIKQSFKLRQESTKLIDIAKQAVEIAIEKDEKTAMKFIKDNT